jgi:hypothetical protein
MRSVVDAQRERVTMRLSFRMMRPPSCVSLRRCRDAVRRCPSGGGRERRTIAQPATASVRFAASFCFTDLVPQPVVACPFRLSRRPLFPQRCPGGAMVSRPSRGRRERRRSNQAGWGVRVNSLALRFHARCTGAPAASVFSLFLVPRSASLLSCN